MKRLHSIRTLTVLAIASISLNGCFNDSSTAPTQDAPPLPAPERITFDFDFFQEPSSLERASKENFFNAYIRVAVVGAITHLVLTPPITALALAFDAVPSPQDDGSYLWVYTFVDGSEEAQIRLRGRVISGDRVEWEMRLSSTEEDVVNALWFEGETWKESDHGFFRFHDIYDAASPENARIDWGADAEGDFLRFTDLAENVDDTLELRVHGPNHSIVSTDVSDDTQSWFIQWNDATGEGSLRAPDYRGGVTSCWDDRQNDVECVPAS
jgi:hypothetical protein